MGSYFWLHGVIGWCNLTLATTSIYIYLGIPLMMREHGWSGTDIGLFQMSALPVVLKFVLASMLDKYRFSKGNYFKWSGILSIGFILCLLAFACLPVEQTSFQVLFVIALIMTLVSSCLDAPINALAIKVLSGSEQSRAGAIRAGMTALASIIGGGVLLWVYAQWGWAWPFIGLMGMTLMAAVALMWAYSRFHENVPVTQEKPMHSSIVGMWRSYFQRPHMIGWNAILVLLFPFIGSGWLYMKPALLAANVSLSEIAWISGVAGGVAALASFIYSQVQTSKVCTPFRALPTFAFLNVVGLLGMYLAIQQSWPIWGTVIAILWMSIVLGLVSGVLFALIMNFSRSEYSASDYGVQTSLFTLSRMLGPLGAGMALDRFGFSGMYLGLTLCALIVWVLCWKVWPKVRQYQSASLG